jgi:hypothetical protein
MPCPARISADCGFARLVRRTEAFSVRLRQSSFRVAQALCDLNAGATTVGFRLVINFMRRPVARGLSPHRPYSRRVHCARIFRAKQANSCEVGSSFLPRNRVINFSPELQPKLFHISRQPRAFFGPELLRTHGSSFGRFASLVIISAVNSSARSLHQPKIREMCSR